MKNLCYLCLLFFTLACADDDDGMTTPTPPEPTPDAPFTYLALGDSYTVGTSVAEEGQWPRQLLRRLETEGVVTWPTEANVLDIVAVNGWTTGDLIRGIKGRDDLRENYDLVSLLIGVNNQFQNRSLEEYRMEFMQLLQEAIERAGGESDRVFVVSIPDYAFTPFGNGREDISRGVDRFNAAAKEITDAAGVNNYFITDISREGLNDPSLVATDGLHPSASQYGRWVEEVLYPALAVQLQP
ncbi:hypothetical protein A3850_011320 [Lewinella sp. 4G2]|nr:hypothetical protein A3850_011320 [Lewinella sp. 4G2]